MAFEMSCADCEGRLIVETLGIVVACPHCGTHLSIPEEIPGVSDAPLAKSSAPTEPSQDEDDDDADDPEETNNKSTWIPSGLADDGPSSFPDFSAAAGSETSPSESNVIVSEPQTQTGSEVPSAIEVKNADPSGVIPAIITDAVAVEPVSGFPVLDDPKTAETPETESEDSEADPAKENAGALKTAAKDAAEDTLPNFAGISVSEEDSAADKPLIKTGGEDGAFPSLSEPAAVVVPKTKPAPKEQTSAKKTASDEAPQKNVYDSVFGSRRGKLIPNPVFQAWLSYTIFVTAGLIIAIYSIFTRPTSNLESLPDVKPVIKSGKVERKLVPEKAEMPPGHTLEIGESQRFGNIEVTPLKVTRGKVYFQGRDYVGSSRTLEPDGPVLMLHLKFKNVSKDQTIAPLDDELLFFRDARPDRKSGALANNFVCKAGQKHKDGEIVLVYDHWFEGDFLLKDQNLNRELEPGEEVTIYIPSEAGRLEDLKGDLIWRVHFRKGYSPSNYGVTTVFEVAFHSDAIDA